jgi:hypothetical protein
MSANLDAERPAIVRACAKHFVDANFVGALRLAENGAPGREFGVLSVNAPTYDAQLAVCVATVCHRLTTFPKNPLWLTPPPTPRLAYNREFVSYFGSIWAPSGVANDPTNLNANWARNVWQLYTNFLALGWAATAFVLAV